MLNRKFILVALVALTMVMLLDSVSATPISYDEAVSGDLNGNVFDLDVGANTVTGTMSIESIFYPDFSSISLWDLDTFIVNVVDGQALTSISLVATLFGSGFGLDFQLIDGASTSDPVLASEPYLVSCCEGVTLSANLFSSLLPLSVGQYLWNPAQDPGFLFGTPNSVSGFDYSVTFNVSGSEVTTVSEPGTFWLLASVLLSFALRNFVVMRGTRMHRAYQA